MTFEQYLRQYIEGVVNLQEYRLVATVNPNGMVSFYIHPMGRNGGTPTFAVVNNTLTPVVENPPGVA